MNASTTLTWGPESTSLTDLLAFREQLEHQLDHARQRAPGNRHYATMLVELEHELAAVRDQIDRKEKRDRRFPAHVTMEENKS